MSKYILKESIKHTYYKMDKLDKNLSKFIMLIYNKDSNLINHNIRLKKSKWLKIQNKHSLVCGEELLEHVYNNIPFYINKAFVERGLWRTKQDELIFISSDIGPNGNRVMFTIVLDSDLKFIFIKTFYDIFNMASKEKGFNKNHKRYTEKGIEQILDFY